MVVLDATFLLLLVDENAGVPTDASGKPIDQWRERIDLLIENLSASKTRVVVPTPALAECLVAFGESKQAVLNLLTGSYGFRIEPFDTAAAVEVACMTEQDGVVGIKPGQNLTKAKLKYDRQIVAIAKTRRIQTIFSDDDGLCDRARRSGITAIRIADLPLPEEPPQGELPLGEPASNQTGGEVAAAETVAADAELLGQDGPSTGVDTSADAGGKSSAKSETDAPAVAAEEPSSPIA